MAIRNCHAPTTSLNEMSAVAKTRKNNYNKKLVYHLVLGPNLSSGPCATPPRWLLPSSRVLAE